MGIVHRNDVHADRESFRDRLRSLLVKLAEFVDADEAADKMGKKFMHQALPPVLTTAEKETSIHGAGEHWSAESNTVEDSVDIALETQIRLMRYGVARLAKDEGQYRLYHCMENSYDPHQDVDPQYIVIEEHLVPAVKRIIKSYPYPLTVVELPVPSQDDKVRHIIFYQIYAQNNRISNFDENFFLLFSWTSPIFYSTKVLFMLYRMILYWNNYNDQVLFFE